MSNTNDTNTTIISLLSSTGLVYTIYHAYKFDRCKCLVPRRKDWFRVVLTWQLILCSMGTLLWGGGFAYIKYTLGWVYLPTVGAMPFPTSMYTSRYKTLNDPFTLAVCVGYSLQVSLNAEEGLYWYHLMRAVRQPKSTKGWFNSRFFFAWVALSLLTPVGLFCSGWVSYVDMSTQMSRMSVVGGAIALTVVLSSSIVLFKFPGFLEDVKKSGAGPEVRSRLHFYHEVNKVRTFFRFIFVATILTLGIDGLTPAMKINLTPLAADLVNQLSFMSYFFANIASVTLYLPRAWGNLSPLPPPVMIGGGGGGGRDNGTSGGNVQHVPTRIRGTRQDNHEASQALISLLREGGQWDEDDDIRVAAVAVAGHSMMGKEEDFVHSNSNGFSNNDTGTKRRESDWSYDAESQIQDSGRPPRRLSALVNWTSPFGIGSNEAKSTDTKIQLRQVQNASEQPDHKF